MNVPASVGEKAGAAEHFRSVALAAIARRDFTGALGAIDAALSHLPDSSTLWADRGGVLQMAGEFAAAAECYRRALELDPRHPDANHNAALLLLEAGQAEDAIAGFQAAVAAAPERANFHASLGNGFYRLKRFREAVVAYGYAERLNPGNANVLCNLGIALRKEGRLADAEGHLRRALELKPDLAEAWAGLGDVLRSKRRLDEALAAYSRAVEIAPRLMEAWCNGGFTLQLLERYTEAETWYRRAVAGSRDPAEAHFHLAHVLLLQEHYREGFEEYLWRGSRMDTSVAPNGMPYATALPQDLWGQTLLLVRDQGIGDELFFLRFAPELKRRGARIVYQAGRKLAPLLTRTTWLDGVTVEGEPAELAHMAVNAADLPHLLYTGIIPPPVALEPLSGRLERARKVLADLGKGPYIGVTWRAGTPLSEQADLAYRCWAKEIALEAAARMLPAEGTVVSLQRAPKPNEIPTLAELLGRPVHDLGAWNDDLEDTLGLLAVLDAYYGVSNTNMHLLAGLGKAATVWAVFPPEWRWLVAGNASPWFPGFRIIRQRRDGSWPDLQPG